MNSSTTATNEPCVGVIIPVRNRPILVRDALSTVCEQSRPPNRLIVVDDGSSDETPDVIEHWLQSHNLQGARLLRQPWKGAAAARNAGMAQCSDCDFVAFLDSDDLWPPNFLVRTIDQLLGTPEAVAVSVDRQKQSPRGNVRKQTNLSGISADPIDWIYQFDAGIASCTLLRTWAVNQVKGFPVEYPTGHDILFFGRMATLGPWLYAPGEPVVFRKALSDTGTDMTHIRRTISNPQLYWAMAEELLADELRQLRRVPARFKNRIASRWRRAGQSAARNYDFNESFRCYCNSLSYSPFTIETWRDLLANIIRMPQFREHRHG